MGSPREDLLMQKDFVCTCGNIFMADAEFCRKCGRQRLSEDRNWLRPHLVAIRENMHAVVQYATLVGSGEDRLAETVAKREEEQRRALQSAMREAAVEVAAEKARQEMMKAEAEQDHAALRRQIGNLEVALKSSHTSLESSRAELKQAQDDLQNHLRMVSASNTALSEERTGKAQLESEFLCARAASSEWQARMQAMKTKCDALCEEQRLNARLESEFEGARVESRELQTRIQVVQTREIAMSMEQESQREHNARLEAELVVFRTEASVADSDALKIERKRNACLESEIMGLREQLQQAKMLNDTLKVLSPPAAEVTGRPGSPQQPRYAQDASTTVERCGGGYRYYPRHFSLHGLPDRGCDGKITNASLHRIVRQDRFVLFDPTDHHGDQEGISPPTSSPSQNQFRGHRYGFHHDPPHAAHRHDSPHSGMRLSDPRSRRPISADARIWTRSL